jgi:hypothetical protein
MLRELLSQQLWHIISVLLGINPILLLVKYLLNLPQGLDILHIILISFELNLSALLSKYSVNLF